MGVIHKLKKEIIDFIIEKKKKDPAISCRKLVFLIKQEFNKNVSKSSINSVIKEFGLSMPVGRRCVLEQGSYEFKSAGVLFLKAADWLLGGSLNISKAVNKYLEFDDPEILSKIEYLIYSDLFSGTVNKNMGLLRNATKVSLRATKGSAAIYSSDDKKRLLRPPTLRRGSRNDTKMVFHNSLNIENNLFDADLKKEDMLAYLIHLQSVRGLCPEIISIISGLTKRIRGLKLNLIDKPAIYLDGQLHTVWPSPKVPNSFSTTFYNVKSYVSKMFLENSPVILFMSPGYDAPTEEFFNFISSLDGKKSVSSVSLIDNDLTEIETMSLQELAHKHFVVFGIWPWQFGQYREIKSVGEFKPFHFVPADKTYYIAETTIELSQTNVNKRVVLNGCVLKNSLKGKEVLSICTTFNFEQLKPEEIAALYLNKWPNLEEGFINFSRSIENFVRGSKNVIVQSMDEIASSPAAPRNDILSPLLSVKESLDLYLMMLDSFVRLNFLPDGYEKDDFSTIKDRFYDLKGILTTKRNEIIIKFSPSVSYPNIKELKYACNRVNERNVLVKGSKKLWLLV